MRQLTGYMKAFGLTQDEIETVAMTNPAFIVGADPAEAVQRSRGELRAAE
jgi:hypothetical protein